MLTVTQNRPIGWAKATLLVAALATFLVLATNAAIENQHDARFVPVERIHD